MIRAALATLALVLTIPSGRASASDALVAVQPAGDEKFNYVLTTNSPATVKYGVILMPGGNGRMNPHMEGIKIVFSGFGNFLIRSRELFAGPQFVAASTDATTTPGRIMAIVQDLEKRYGEIEIYVIGTSRSTESTMSLAKSLDGQVAGFVHSSSMSAIADAGSAPKRWHSPIRSAGRAGGRRCGWKWHRRTSAPSTCTVARAFICTNDF